MADLDAPETLHELTILVVCTGNICRSPMTEVLLAAHLAERAIAAQVTSAGLLYDDRPASAGAVAAMHQRGLDLEPHRSRTITKPLVAASDLIIAMEPRHVREVVALHDDAWPVTFTLRELTSRAAATGPRTTGEDLRDWLVRLGSGRRRVDLLADDPALAVLDPYRQDQAVYDATAADLDAACQHLITQAFPLASEHASETSHQRGLLTQVRRAG